MSSAPMLTWTEAQTRLLSAIAPLPSEWVPLSESHRRYLAEPVIAPMDLPRFDNSAMDGYAVLSVDTAKSEDKPVRLALRGRVTAGDAADAVVEAGSCVRIFTGSVLPHGADAVVMQEDTTPEGTAHVLINTPVKPWENVRFRGEDVRRGDTVLRAGIRLGSQSLALLGALGIETIKVGAQPRISLLATGNELQEAGQVLRPGSIYESNRLAIASLLRDAGAHAQAGPLVPDSLSATREALTTAFQHSDAVVTTGGVSVGELDMVKEAFAEMGGKIDFWRVALRPGKPFLFGRFGNKILFGLPGNPVSAMVTAMLFVRPAVARWQGADPSNALTESRLLAESLSNPGARTHFMRVTLNSKGEVVSAGTQGSHLLKSVAQSAGLVEIPPQTTLQAGTLVPMWPWP